MATAPKPKEQKPEEKPGDGKMIDIDIYEMEMQEAKPHWLSAQQKYSGLHDEKRRRRNIERSKEISEEGQMNRRDPTRSEVLRRRGRAIANRRVFELHKRLRLALQENDLIGLRKSDVVPADFLTYVEGDAGRLERSEFMLRRIVEETIATPPDWLRAVIENAVWRGVQQVGQELKVAIDGLDASDVVRFHSAAVGIEVEGIADETGRRTLRSVAQAIERKLTPEAMMRDVRELLYRTTRKRLIMLVNMAVVRAVNAGKLFGYRHNGVRQVGIEVEWLPGRHLHDADAMIDAAPLLAAIVIEKRRKERLARRRRRARKEAEEAKERLQALKVVSVLTAGDDKVCEKCLDISAAGPYEIDTALSLIPAHPNCRCAFVAFGDLRFAEMEAEE